MASVSVNPPRTPVTKGSSGIAMATLPNVCKMPGPPPPFVPTPLPNIGKSGDSPKGYSKKVKVEGQTVAIKGASFGSMGDAASKGTGGGLVSMNTHGPTKFIGPGSFDVKIEGKCVQFLGDSMVNNCGPSGSPPNSSTVAEMQASSITSADAALVGEDECARIKAEFKIECGPHKDNKKIKNKHYQSHHVLQDKALRAQGVPSKDGYAVLLYDSHRDTEHGTITARQNSRMRNKKSGGGGALPAATLEELIQQAREDLIAGLEGKRKAADGRLMTKKEAETAAYCIIMDAGKHSKMVAKGNNVILNDSSPVDRPGGCLGLGTQVHLVSGERLPVELLRIGDRIVTSRGSAEIIRLDPCWHDVVVVEMNGEQLTLASNHHVVDEDGHLVRAGNLQPGVRIRTHSGCRKITNVIFAAGLREVWGIGLSRHDLCVIGSSGLLALATHVGPLVVQDSPVAFQEIL